MNKKQLITDVYNNHKDFNVFELHSYIRVVSYDDIYEVLPNITKAKELVFNTIVNSEKQLNSLDLAIKFQDAYEIDSIISELENENKITRVTTGVKHYLKISDDYNILTYIKWLEARETVSEIEMVALYSMLLDTDNKDFVASNSTSNYGYFTIRKLRIDGTILGYVYQIEESYTKEEIENIKRIRGVK